jgi:hypothetical protein
MLESESPPRPNVGTDVEDGALCCLDPMKLFEWIQTHLITVRCASVADLGWDGIDRESLVNPDSLNCFISQDLLDQWICSEFRRCHMPALITLLYS